MTVRIWRIPNRYPNKHVGVYQSSGVNDDDLRFRQGRHLDLDNERESMFDFHESSLEKLHTLGCLWTNIAPPLVNSDIALALHMLAPSDHQLLKAVALTAEGPTTEFSLVNVTCLCDCIDYEKSTFHRWEIGGIRQVKNLRFTDDSCMGSRHLARLAPYKGYILISEELYQGLRKLKFKGLHFEFDRDGDDFR